MYKTELLTHSSRSNTTVFFEYIKRSQTTTKKAPTQHNQQQTKQHRPQQRSLSLIHHLKNHHESHFSNFLVYHLHHPLTITAAIQWIPPNIRNAITPPCRTTISTGITSKNVYKIHHMSVHEPTRRRRKGV